jgi:hypothetical protein
VKWGEAEQTFLWAAELPAGVAALEAARAFLVTKEKDPRFHPIEQSIWALYYVLLDDDKADPHAIPPRDPLGGFVPPEGGVLFLGRSL